MLVEPRDPSACISPTRRRRRSLTVLVLSVVALAGCGSSGDAATASGGDVAVVGNLADVVVAGDSEAKPTVTYNWPLSVEETVSRVITDGDGAPIAPTDLVVQPLIQGEGAAVTEGQTVVAHYTGLIWGTGKEFDSSWSGGAPASFSLAPGGVIDAWSQGLVGVEVGSQVVMVVPPALGYGADGNPDAGISGTDTLVFVIDILDAY